MNYNEIRKMAKNMDIYTHRMKKPELILAIQRAENNIECFGTPRVDYCNEGSCLWKDECITVNHAIGKMKSM